MNPLTDRQTELLAYVASGLSIDQAAKRCYIVPKSAYNMLSSARSKAQVSSMIQLAVRAVHEGWLEHQGEGTFTPAIRED